MLVCTLPLFIHPGNSELVNAIGDAKTLNQISFVKLRMFVVLFFNGSKNFFYCLMILRFVGERLFRSSNTFAAFIIYCFYWLLISLLYCGCKSKHKNGTNKHFINKIRDKTTFLLFYPVKRNKKDYYLSSFERFYYRNEH